MSSRCSKEVYSQDAGGKGGGGGGVALIDGKGFLAAKHQCTMHNYLMNTCMALFEILFWLPRSFEGF